MARSGVWHRRGKDRRERRAAEQRGVEPGWGVDWSRVRRGLGAPRPAARAATGMADDRRFRGGRVTARGRILPSVRAVPAVGIGGLDRAGATQPERERRARELTVPGGSVAVDADLRW